MEEQDRKEKNAKNSHRSEKPEIRGRQQHQPRTNVFSGGTRKRVEHDSTTGTHQSVSFIRTITTFGRIYIFANQVARKL